MRQCHHIISEHIVKFLLGCSICTTACHGERQICRHWRKYRIGILDTLCEQIISKLLYTEDFYLDREQRTAEQVQMMNLYRTDLDYLATDLAEGVILPYQKNNGGEDNENLVFVALKPTGDGDVRDVYAKFRRI